MKLLTNFPGEGRIGVPCGKWNAGFTELHEWVVSTALRNQPLFSHCEWGLPRRAHRNGASSLSALSPMTSATTTSAATTSSSRAKSASEFSGGNLSNRSTD